MTLEIMLVIVLIFLPITRSYAVELLQNVGAYQPSRPSAATTRTWLGAEAMWYLLWFVGTLLMCRRHWCWVWLESRHKR